MISEALKEKAVQVMHDNPVLFQLLHQEFLLTKEQVLDTFIYYNSGVDDIDNSIYESLPIRAAMFIEYQLKGSWHEERQDVLMRFLEFCKPRSIIDVGFGAPTRYVKEMVLPDEDITLTLADKFAPAFDFAQAVLESWQPGFSKRVHFKQADLDELQYLGDYEVYIFQDAIEHAAQPTEFLTLNIEAAPPGAWFILSLPIAPLIPCHFISWETAEAAIDWVERCGLEVLEQQRVFVNPAVDEFAKDWGNISNLMLVTRRVTGNPITPA